MSKPGEDGAPIGETGYEVGYGKPPTHTRFKQGTSGNPNGRPRGKKTDREIFRAIIDERINVQTAHGIKKMSKLEAVLHTLVNRALKGEAKAVEQLLKVTRELGLHDEVTDTLGHSHAQLLAEEDKAILRRFMRNRESNPS